MTVFDAMNYLKLNGETVVKAFEVASQLQEWLFESHESDAPLACVSVSMGFVELAIGEFGVWSSQVDDSDELTFDACRASYFNQLSVLLEPFAQDPE